MEKSKISAKYRQKGRDSFETRLNLFLFQETINNRLSDNVTGIEFENGIFANELIELYTTQYFQLDYEYRIQGKAIKDIWQEMTLWKKEHVEVVEILQEHYLAKIFPKIFPEEEFALLFMEEEDRKCHYCGVTEAKIKALMQKRKLYKKRERGFTLEIDRKKPNLEYSLDNSVLCCYWCNNAKTDEFCDKEFEAVGKAIGAIWDYRLR